MQIKSILYGTLIILMCSCGSGGGPSVVTSPDGHPYLTWDANDEPDLDGYVVYWGPESTVYERNMDVGLDRVVYLSTLELYDLTFFAVTAYDTSGNESDYSEETEYP